MRPHPKESEIALRKFVSESGFKLDEIGVVELVTLALEFYASVRFAGLSAESTADMLLFQYGTYNWGKGENFEFDVTRQFVSASSADDDALSQLHFTAYFAPTSALRAVGSLDRWCEELSALPEFQAFLRSSRGYEATRNLSPSRITLRWEEV